MLDLNSNGMGNSESPDPNMKPEINWQYVTNEFLS